MPIMRLTQMLAAAGAEKAFIFDAVTTTPAESFALPLESPAAGVTYNFNVDWGDGNDSDITVYNHADVTHTYVSAGTHEVKITGTIQGWSFNNNTNAPKMYELKSCGPLRVGNNGNYFYGCSNLTITATDVLDLTGTVDFIAFFRNCSSLTTIPTIGSWDTVAVISMVAMFYGATVFNQDISGWDVSSVTSIQHMFNSATVFNQDIGGWDTSSVASANSMFRSALAFNQNIGGWDTSLVTTMEEMFRSATAFDQNIDGWNITSLTNATSMFIYKAISTANYNALILSWSPQAQTIVANFHGGDSKYTGGGAVETARTAWIAKGWTITDGGVA